MSDDTTGYIVLAKRPERNDPSRFRYEPAGGFHESIEPVENHQAYCELSAEENPSKYSDVEYVIVEVRVLG